MTSPKTLTGLNPREYEHPFDARALNALQQTPGLHRLVRAYSTHYLERALTVAWTGSYIRVSGDSYPKTHAALDLVCDTIHLPARPSLYIRWDYAVNALTTGVENPIILLNSGAIDYLSENELTWLIGHEVGHIKSRHVLYLQVADMLGGIATGVGQVTLGLGKLASMPIMAAFYWWQRMSELSADRAGLLACQDLDASLRLLMKMAGVPRKHFNAMRVASFLDQAREFQELDYNTLSRTWRVVQTLQMGHPWTVLRAAQLMQWVESGEYQAVLDRTAAQVASASVPATRAFCHNCGGRLEGQEMFCPTCGQRLEDATEA